MQIEAVSYMDFVQDTVKGNPSERGFLYIECSEEVVYTVLLQYGIRLESTTLLTIDQSRRPDPHRLWIYILVKQLVCIDFIV